MAAVMAGGMIPPLGLALACLLFPTRFTKAERRTVPQNLVMGASFVTGVRCPLPCATRCGSYPPVYGGQCAGRVP